MSRRHSVKHVFFFQMCSHICPAWVQMTPWTEDANDVALEHALFAKLTRWWYSLLSYKCYNHHQQQHHYNQHHHHYHYHQSASSLSSVIIYSSFWAIVMHQPEVSTQRHLVLEPPYSSLLNPCFPSPLHLLLGHLRWYWSGHWWLTPLGGIRNGRHHGIPREEMYCKPGSQKTTSAAGRLLENTYFSTSSACAPN